jgi:hypothetical protein
MRRLGQPMELEALRRFIINVDVEVVPQNVSDFFNGVYAVELQNIVADDGRAVRALCTSPEARVGLDVDRLLCDGQRRAQDQSRVPLATPLVRADEERLLFLRVVGSRRR